MATIGKREGSGTRSVFVSNTAENMISSLHPSDKDRIDATINEVRSSVFDEAKIKKLVGVENAYVARAGDLRIIFTIQEGSVFVKSVVRNG